MQPGGQLRLGPLRPRLRLLARAVDDGRVLPLLRADEVEESDEEQLQDVDHRSRVQDRHHEMRLHRRRMQQEQ